MLFSCLSKAGFLIDPVVLKSELKKQSKLLRQNKKYILNYLAKSSTKVKQSQKDYIFCLLIVFYKLEMPKMKTSLNHFALKYKLILKANFKSFKQLRNFYQISSFA